MQRIGKLQSQSVLALQPDVQTGESYTTTRADDDLEP
jgi:hypothetical protein